MGPPGPVAPVSASCPRSDVHGDLRVDGTWASRNSIGPNPKVSVSLAGVLEQPSAAHAGDRRPLVLSGHQRG